MKNQLDWPDLWNHLGMTKDKGDRWYPGDDTPKWVADYLSGYRSPSRAYPYSYAKPLLTKKFAKVLAETDEVLAKECGLS